MLGHEQVKTVANQFGVYEHDWVFYSTFLGEPHLINNTIVYFDGEIVFISAFPIGDVSREINAGEIDEILNSKLEFLNAKAVDIWGRVATLPASLRIGPQRILKHCFFDYDSNLFDVAVSLEAFTYASNSKARLARNAAINKRLETKIVARTHFTARHIEIIGAWLNNHEVSPVHRCFVAGAHSFIRNENVYLVEVYDELVLKGFAVLSLPSPKAAVLTQAYFENQSGSRYADSVTAASIDFVKERGLLRLHLGYSSTESLLKFKRKWGANLDGPPFRQAFYSNSPEMRAFFDAGCHPWVGRLLNETIQTAKTKNNE